MLQTVSGMRKKVSMKDVTVLLIAVTMAGWFISAFEEMNAFPLRSWTQFSTGSITAVRTAGVGAPRLISAGATKDGIIKATNANRRNKGLRPLAENALLDRIAAKRLEDMFQKQYFGHESPSGEKASTIAKREGYRYKIIAENIASISTADASAEAFLLIWMRSPGHRANILDPEIKEIGVAVREGRFKDETAWIGVQIFGLKSPGAADK
jgi:uncharacterized protein YkwD